MAIANARILTFDTGIERIIQSGERVDQPLPERNALTPTGEPVRVRLDEMLNAPALNELLRGSVRPQIADKTVLAPGRYQTLLDEAQAELRHRAGGESNALANAAALLEEEQQLRDLLNTLRNLLVQG
jgi:type III secretion system YscX family protein